MRRHPRTIDPFAGYFSPKLSKGIRELLLSPRVQGINFDFGSVLVHAPHFGEAGPRACGNVAGRLRSRWQKTRQPVPLRASEINLLRLEAAKKGYDNGFYSHDGLPQI
jgi:hypothetical protein